MPDDQIQPTLPPDEVPSWLARNRKIVILVGIVLILSVTAAVLVWLPRRTTTTAPAGQTTTNTTNTEVTNTYSRPTFQRSTVTNTSTTLPPTYRPPTTDDLRRTIANLNSSSSKKQ